MRTKKPIYNKEYILNKMNDLFPDEESFWKAIEIHLKNSYFSYVYQGLFFFCASHLKYNHSKLPIFIRIKIRFKKKIDFGDFLSFHNFVKCIIDLFRTRTSNYNHEKLKSSIDSFDWDQDWDKSIDYFLKNYNNIGTTRDEVSLATKILHFKNPWINPIIDQVILLRLGIGSETNKVKITKELCLYVKEAFLEFITNNQNYFEMNKKICRKYRLFPFLPNMKLIDMALYQ